MSRVCWLYKVVVEDLGWFLGGGLYFRGWATQKFLVPGTNREDLQHDLQDLRCWNKEFVQVILRTSGESSPDYYPMCGDFVVKAHSLISSAARLFSQSNG